MTGKQKDNKLVSVDTETYNRITKSIEDGTIIGPDGPATTIRGAFRVAVAIALGIKDKTDDEIDRDDAISRAKKQIAVDYGFPDASMVDLYWENIKHIPLNMRGPDNHRKLRHVIATGGDVDAFIAALSGDVPV